MVEHDLLQLLVDLLLLPQDDITLPLDSTTFKLGVLQDVANDVNCLGNVLTETFGVVDSLLARCVCIQMSTEIFDFQLEGLLISGVGSFESHVFKEMSCPVCLVRFSPRPSIYPHTDRSSLRMRVRLCGHSQTIRES